MAPAAGDARTFDAGSVHLVALGHVRQQKPLDIAHACVRMFYTGTWAPGVDIGPVQEVLGREDVATVIHSCVMRLRRRL
jgi:hypothetical protein